jgi:hypothetical protein
MESDGNVDAAVRAEEPTEEEDAEEPTPPTAQIPLAEQRQSVFVSVLSGSDKKESTLPPSSEEQATVSENSSKEGSSTSETAASTQHKDPHRKLSETSPVFPYPSTSTPTPTYGPQFSPYGSFPPHPHMMYPPSVPPSTMYPFYGYHGAGPMQIPHPPPSAYYQHMAPPITTGEQMPMPQNMQPQVPFGQPAAQPTPAQSPASGPVSCSAPTSSAVLPPTVTSTATTVGGVRVSVLEKPPTQLPMVTVPYHIPGAAAQRPLRPQPGGYPMEIPQAPGMRTYVGGGGGHSSPDGLEPRHLHPLSQVYRPGMIGPYPPHLQMPHHASYHQVRLDPSGIPYVEWPVSCYNLRHYSGLQVAAFLQRMKSGTMPPPVAENNSTRTVAGTTFHSSCKVTVQQVVAFYCYLTTHSCAIQGPPILFQTAVAEVSGWSHFCPLRG